MKGVRASPPTPTHSRGGQAQGHAPLSLRGRGASRSFSVAWAHLLGSPPPGEREGGACPGGSRTSGDKRVLTLNAPPTLPCPAPPPPVRGSLLGTGGGPG